MDNRKNNPAEIFIGLLALYYVASKIVEAISVIIS